MELGFTRSHVAATWPRAQAAGPPCGASLVFELFAKKNFSKRTSQLPTTWVQAAPVWSWSQIFLLVANFGRRSLGSSWTNLHLPLCAEPPWFVGGYEHELIMRCLILSCFQVPGSGSSGAKLLLILSSLSAALVIARSSVGNSFSLSGGTVLPATRVQWSTRVSGIEDCEPTATRWRPSSFTLSIASSSVSTL